MTGLAVAARDEVRDGSQYGKCASPRGEREVHGSEEGGAIRAEESGRRENGSETINERHLGVTRMFELVDSINDAPVIKLVGVGGGGSNAVQHMVSSGIEGVDFICANTDAQALKAMQAQTVLHIGQSITKGLGAGANPEIGRQAAMEDRDRIQDIIEGTDMLFITAGMGGGTGTGRHSRSSRRSRARWES